MDNIKYTDGLCSALKELGHDVFLIYRDCCKTMNNVMSVVLMEDVARKKKLKESMSTDERKMFIAKWKMENEVFLKPELGVDGMDSYHFLSGCSVPA